MAEPTRITVYVAAPSWNDAVHKIVNLLNSRCVKDRLWFVDSKGEPDYHVNVPSHAAQPDDGGPEVISVGDLHIESAVDVIKAKVDGGVINGE